MGNRCSIQQSEEINCCLEQSPENRLYRPFRYFWATLYNTWFCNRLEVGQRPGTHAKQIHGRQEFKYLNCVLTLESLTYMKHTWAPFRKGL